MKLAEQYNEYAAECLRHADIANDEWSRLFLIDLAQRWHDLAETFRAVMEESPAQAETGDPASAPEAPADSKKPTSH